GLGVACKRGGSLLGVPHSPSNSRFIPIDNRAGSSDDQAGRVSWRRRAPADARGYVCPDRAREQIDEKDGFGHDLSPGNYIQRTNCYAATGSVDKTSSFACSSADGHG